MMQCQKTRQNLRPDFNWLVSLRLALVTCTMLAVAACDTSAPESATRTPDLPTPDAPAPSPAQASPGDNVSFFVIGKAWHFRQDVSGLQGPNSFDWFAEIFTRAGGQVSEGSMQLQAPSAELIPFDHDTDNGAVLHARAGTVHQQVADLDAELPNGDYAFSFHTPAGDVQDFVASLGDLGSVTKLPPSPTIQLSQEGVATDPRTVSVDKDLRISWTPFTAGRADPKGIADDLIFVIMSDCLGKRIYHSGRPLGTPNPLSERNPTDAAWLTYAATEVTIPNARLTPGMNYQLEVETVKLLDTDRRQGVIGITANAATTHMDVQTTGDLPAGACPES